MAHTGHKMGAPPNTQPGLLRCQSRRCSTSTRRCGRASIGDVVLCRCLKNYHRVCYFGCLKGVPKSVQVLFNGIEALMVLTLIILK